MTLTAATGAAVMLACPAFAHVSVSPGTAAAGSSTELTFRVPNEESNAETDKVTVLIPTQHPIAQVLVKPVAGWTITTKTAKLTTPLVTDDGKFTSVISQITWTGGRIQPGEYQDFAVSVDPLPDLSTQLVFKALQTYTNGDVVRWIDLQQPGRAEPEHPAPVLTLTSGAASTGAGDSTSAGPSVTPSTAAPAAPATPSTDMPGMTGMAGKSDSSSSWQGVVALIALALTLVALAVAGLALRRARRTV